MNWVIKIVPAENPTPEVPAVFKPDLIGVPPGTPLKAQGDDKVTWNNVAKEDHWPWPVDADGKELPVDQVKPEFGNFLSKEIPADFPNGVPSTPEYNVPNEDTTINYCCKLYPKMLGQIKVTKYPGK